MDAAAGRPFGVRKLTDPETTRRTWISFRPFRTLSFVRPTATMGVSDIVTSAYQSVRDLFTGKAYKYNAIPAHEGETDETDEHRDTPLPDSKRRILLLTIAAMVFAILFSLALGFR